MPVHLVLQLYKMNVGECTRENMLDQALHALSNAYRRELLVALLEHNPQDDTDLDPLGVVDADDDAHATDADDVANTTEVDLVHTHLPVLEQMGYISWNSDTGEISRMQAVSPLPQGATQAEGRVAQ